MAQVKGALTEAVVRNSLPGSFCPHTSLWYGAVVTRVAQNGDWNVRIGVGLGVLMASLAVMASCVEDPTTTPNSDRGHLFVDLEQALAAGWQSEVWIQGPIERRTHLPLEMKEVTSSDSSVVEVEDFEWVSDEQIEGVRVDLDVVGPGEAALEFKFSVVGDYEYESEGQEEELIYDSFGVQAREVSSIGLSRMLEEASPQGPYGQCPESGLGTYLMSHLDEYVVHLYYEKRDAEGNLLRGKGKFPFKMTPEDAVEVDEIDESRHLVELRPRKFGTVTLEPTMAGRSFEAHFVSGGDVTQMEARLYALNQEGRRAGEAAVLVPDGVYEVEIGPHIPEGGPICGGAMEATAQSLTPAICDVVGQVVDTGNPALVVTEMGECHLRMTLEGAAGGQGLVEEVALPVEPNW